MWGPFDLDGKKAAVTGAAHGIGYAIARRYLEAGADVLMADLDESAARAATERLNAEAWRGKAASLALDVAADDAGDRLVRAAIEAFGRLDILVNNAGIFPLAALAQTTPALLDRVLGINLRGPALCSKAAAARMIEQGDGGVILTIASVDAFHPSMVGLAAYDASKGGVIMLTKAMALEYSSAGIRVVAIAPGGVNTEGARAFQGQMAASLPPAALEAMVQASSSAIPLGRTAEPDEIATAAVFLVSPAASYITGTTLIVDGGMLVA